MQHHTVFCPFRAIVPLSLQLAPADRDESLESTTSAEPRPMLTSGRLPGLKKNTIRPGDGCTFACEGDSVEILFSGFVADDGRVFDSSAKSGPLRFVLGKGFFHQLRVCQSC